MGISFVAQYFGDKHLSNGFSRFSSRFTNQRLGFKYSCWRRFSCQCWLIQTQLLWCEASLWNPRSNISNIQPVACCLERRPWALLVRYSFSSCCCFLSLLQFPSAFRISIYCFPHSTIKYSLQGCLYQMCLQAVFFFRSCRFAFFNLSQTAGQWGRWKKRSFFSFEILAN